MKRVVVAIDGSEVSERVIDYALHYAAREKDAVLLFLHVVDSTEHQRVTFRGHSVEVAPSEEEVLRDFTEFVKKRIQADKAPEPQMKVHVAYGNPYDRIVGFAEEVSADMIMIGHRGLSDLQRFLLGSVAAKVVAHAPCSVYVHRPKAETK